MARLRSTAGRRSPQPPSRRGGSRAGEAIRRGRGPCRGPPAGPGSWRAVRARCRKGADSAASLDGRLAGSAVIHHGSAGSHRRGFSPSRRLPSEVPNERAEGRLGVVVRRCRRGRCRMATEGRHDRDRRRRLQQVGGGARRLLARASARAWSPGSGSCTMTCPNALALPAFSRASACPGWLLGGNYQPSPASARHRPTSPGRPTRPSRAEPVDAIVPAAWVGCTRRSRPASFGVVPSSTLDCMRRAHPPRASGALRQRRHGHRQPIQRTLGIESRPPPQSLRGGAGAIGA